ncbi:MAG: GDP-mannose 4,6-dehydratase [Candidatus Margulisbacteria bacterium]|nr:GDP-mannose 4,6-dehydratase [Candidatus Margulisiibacteriota bacterium]MBU1617346.1 GDP-mannose 4,6-dehydratase [Candidatus Margulisiibacteriota bacterium]
MANKILITGSAGFIGRALIERLRTETVEIVECDLSLGHDLLDQKQTLALPPLEIVVHLAANTNVQTAFEQPYPIYRDNLVGTLNLLEYCRLNKVKRIIYSSSYVYGQPQTLPIDETHPVMINNPYGRSKLIGEQLVAAYSEDFGLAASILRNFNVYGQGQSPRFLIPSVIAQLYSESPVIKVADLKPKRDYIYIKDVVEAMWRACRSNAPGTRTYNLGCGVSYSVGEALELIFKLSGRRKPIESAGTTRKNDIMDTVADISKAKNELGWQPRFDFAAGLTDLLRAEGRIK